MGKGGRIRTCDKTGSKPVALPLRYAPVLSAGMTSRDRTDDIKTHNIALYRLGYGHH